MKRDMDLIRDILCFVEKMTTSTFDIQHIKLDKTDENTIRYHIQLMVDAGFIYVNTYQPKDENFFEIITGYRLTWEGHEFLDLIKKDTNWNRAKELMANTGGMAFKVLIDVLVKYAAGQAGLVP